jgi:hypothetical protein
MSQFNCDLCFNSPGYCKFSPGYDDSPSLQPVFAPLVLVCLSAGTITIPMQIKMSECRDGNTSRSLLLHSTPFKLEEDSSPCGVQVTRFICGFCPCRSAVYQEEGLLHFWNRQSRCKMWVAHNNNAPICSTQMYSFWTGLKGLRNSVVSLLSWREILRTVWMVWKRLGHAQHWITVLC